MIKWFLLFIYKSKLMDLYAFIHPAKILFTSSSLYEPLWEAQI